MNNNKNKNYSNLEIDIVEDKQDTSIKTTISRTKSIKEIIKQKSQKEAKNCKDSCKMYGWVAPAMALTLGIIVGVCYLIKFIDNTL